MSASLSISIVVQAAGAAIATLTIVNDGAGTEAAGTPTQPFGWIFKKGDIPAGTAPVFKAGGVVQPYSAGLQRYHSDGSLARCTFVLRKTFSLAAGASQTIAISGGGSWPAASSRTLAEVYANNLFARCPAAPIAGANIKGTWLARLANDAHMFKQPVKWLSGAAGEYWKASTEVVVEFTGKTHSNTTLDGISIDTGALTVGQKVFGSGIPAGTTIASISSSSSITMSAPASSTLTNTAISVEHYWLRFDHYFAALSDGNGNLGGFRWLGRLRYPRFNPASVEADCTKSFEGVTWFENGNSHVLGGPWSPVNFTVTAGLQPQFSSAQAFYTGAFADGNCIGGYFTVVGGSLPTTSPQIDTTNRWAIQVSDTSTNFSLRAFPSTSPFSTPVSVSSQGSGTMTFHPTVMIRAFTSVAFANADANYNFFKGVGSIAAETNCRGKIDQLYWQSTKLLPPFMMNLQGASNGSTAPNGSPATGVIADTTYTYDWTPYNVGELVTTQQQVGDHSDLGVLKATDVVDFYNQSKASEKLVRIEGMSAMLTSFDFKDAATDTLPNILNASYAGYPGSLKDTLVWTGGGDGGYDNSLKAFSLVFSQNDGSHKPPYSHYAFLRCGRLEMLDLLTEQAVGGVGSVEQGNRNVTVNGRNFYGLCCRFQGNGELRTMAWLNRDVQFAAAVYPRDPTGNTSNPVYSDGTETARYLEDMAAYNASWPAFELAPANGLLNSYMVASGFYTPGPDWLGNYCVDQPSHFTDTYYTSGFFIRHMWTGDADAGSFLDTLATKWNKILNTWGGFSLYNFGQHWTVGDKTIENGGQPLISDDSHMFFTPKNWLFGSNTYAGAITWPIGGPISYAANSMTNAPFPGNGDCYFWSTFFGTLPGGVSEGQPTFLRDVAFNAGTGKYTFNLALTKGGPAISITNSGSAQIPAYVALDKVNSPSAASGSIPFSNVFCAQIRASMCWLKALRGITLHQAALDDANVRLPASGWNYTGQVAAELRWAYQDHYGA